MRTKFLTCAFVLIANAVLAPLAMQAQAADIAIGVNVVNPYGLSAAEQDTLLGRIKASGVHVIRASITLDDHGIAFAERARAAGLQIEWMIFRFGGYAPGGPPLSSADAAQFARSFAPILAKLEADGIVLAAFELGNEFNLGGYNADLPRSAKGMVFGASDLATNAALRPVTAGYLRYLQVLAALKDIRDHSKLNRRTPILTGGLAVYENEDGPLPAGTTAQVVSASATLDYLRAHGLDGLVDGYALHVYPRGNSPGDPAAAGDRNAKLAKYVLSECRAAGSASGKPCWLTEWGFNNADRACPIHDEGRTSLVREMMGHFRPYVVDRRLVGLFAYAWNDVPGVQPVSPLTLFRCDELTTSGKASIDASLLE
jgi:hypothetical protein